MRKRKTQGTHTLYLFYKNTLIGNYDVVTDNWEDLYNQLSIRVIRSALTMGFKLKDQIRVSEDYLTDIEKQTRHCEKIKVIDFWQVLAVFFFLYKVNKIESSDFIFLKNKKNKNKKIIV